MTAHLAEFILACILIELTPGPNMTYLAILASSEGRRAGLAAVAGVALGLLVIGLAAAMGLATIIANSPALYALLRWGGVIYMLWLAYDAWRSANETSPHMSQGAAGEGRYFRRGFIVNVLNPKAGVFYVAMLPGFMNPAHALAPQAVTLTLIYVAIATAIHAAIVIGADHAARLLSGDAATIMRKTLAVALALVALWFALETGS